MFSVPLVHEFGIIESFDHKESYNEYNPQKYACISVDDERISSLIEDLLKMKTYYHSLNRPEGNKFSRE